MQQAVIYCRVSTEEQAEHGHHSLSAQESICGRLAKEQGYSVAAVFRDPGRSATNMRRPGLQEMIERCRKDKSINAVFVQDTDRLARNTQDHLAIRAMLQKAGVKLVSASQPMLEDSAEGRMIDTIIASVNQFQSDITSRKTLKGLEEKVRNGGWPKAAPLGYRNTGTGPDEKERIVVPDESVAPLVTRAYELYATGAYSLFHLGNALYAEGLRSRNGGRVQRSKLQWMLKNPFYVGEIRWRGMRAKGRHTALVSREVFDVVQDVFRAHGGGKAKPRKYEYALSGFVYCARCGGRMTPEYHLRKRLTYWRCHKRGGCQPCIRDSVLERQVADAFALIRLPWDFIRDKKEELRRRIEARRAKLGEVRTGLTARKARAEEKKRALGKKLLDGVVKDDDYRRLQNELDEEIVSVDAELRRAESGDDGRADAALALLSFAQDLGSSYEAASVETKRVLLSFAWERFKVDNKALVGVEPTPLVRLFLEEAYGNGPNTHEPLLERGAPVLKGDCHPNRVLADAVRITHSWGPNNPAIRPKVERKMWLRNHTLVNTLLQSPPFVQQSMELTALINRGLKGKPAQSESWSFS